MPKPLKFCAKAIRRFTFVSVAIFPLLALAVAMGTPAGSALAQAPAAVKAQAAQAESQKRAIAKRTVAEKRKALADAGLTDAEIDDLIATLESPEGRSVLLSRLKGLRIAAADPDMATPDASTRAEGDDGHFVALVSERIDLISGQVVAGAALLLDAPRLFNWIKGELTDPAARDTWLRVLWKVLLALAIGLVAEWVARRLLSGPRKSVEGQTHDSLWLRVTFLLARTFLDIMPIVAFGAAAYVALPLVEPSEVTRLVAIALINASVVARAVLAAARMIFAPRVSNLRIFDISDENANYFVVWTRRLTNVAVYGFFLSQAALLLGLSPGGFAALSKTIALLVALLVIIFILQNRRAVAAFIEGAQSSGPASMRMLRRRFADIWHVLAIIYVLALYLVWSLEIRGGFEFVFEATALSLVILVVAKLVIVASHHGMEVGFGIRKDLLQRFPGLGLRASRYFVIVHYVINSIVLVLAVFAILEAWGIGAFDWVGSPLGRHVTGSFVTIAFVAVISVLVWEMISSVIERYLEGGKNGDVAISARAKTLLPLLRRVILIVISVLAGFIVLSEIGVNIGPLLAGAGVVGLAIGFGSQTLVKDVITGVFILVEDQFSVGDVVRVSGKSGVVEAITIRTIRLRDLGGNVHMIPFSAVDTVENMTKDFSRYVFDIGIAYREDVDEVIDVLRVLGDEIQADEYYGNLIKEPLEILGLNEFGDSAIVIRARFTTRPIKQWEVGREFNRRIKHRFDELGIEIPFPHQTIYFGEDKSGSAPPAYVQLDAEREKPVQTAPRQDRPARTDRVENDSDGGGE